MLLFNIKKMKQIRILCMIVVLSGLYSCRKNTLSIPGTNAITTAQVFSTPATVNAYLATLYADMPVEDFAFWNGGFGNFPGNGNEYTADWTDEANWSTSSGTMPAFSTRCRSTGTRSLLAGCKLTCARSPDPRTRWGE